MVDIHTHILPGLDDGAPDLAVSMEMARAMAADGVEVVCGTPHVRDDFPTSAGSMRDALGRVRAGVAEAGLAIDVRGGAEIALDRLPAIGEARSAFGLGGNPGLLLLETPYVSWLYDLPRTCARLRREGVVPVLAHPERNPYVQEQPTILDDVVRAGALVQITAASVDGRLDLDLAHCIASDAHGPGVRDAGMSRAFAVVGGGALGTWLTCDVPAALLEGRELPPRPAPRRRGVLGRLRR